MTKTTAPAAIITWLESHRVEIEPVGRADFVGMAAILDTIDAYCHASHL